MFVLLRTRDTLIFSGCAWVRAVVALPRRLAMFALFGCVCGRLLMIVLRRALVTLALFGRVWVCACDCDAEGSCHVGVV